MRARFLTTIFLFGLVVATVSSGQVAEDGQAEWQAELDQILREIEVTEERRDELRNEFANLDRDRAGLNQALIETNQTIQALERQLDIVEARMSELLAEEDHVRAALAERRDVLAEVLAVLQRMGRAPPPAILVQPEDALAAVRSAILLGAVLPEIRGEALALATDIERLIALRRDQEIEREGVIAAARDLADEQQMLEILISERREALNQTNETLAAEQDRLGGLANEVQTLEELIGAFDVDNEPPGGVQVAAIDPAGVPVALEPIFLGEADRISPAVPFSSARGLLPQPANGEIVVAYGGEDGLGNLAEGLSIATRPGAQVAAPADGWVEFAGPYRSYGNLLIVDAGNGYRIVLAGMDRIVVQRGQFVLAGEPIGTMSAVQSAAVNVAELGTLRPVLYVEFRKDGESINPGPWWADPY